MLRTGGAQGQDSGHDRTGRGEVHGRGVGTPSVPGDRRVGRDQRTEDSTTDLWRIAHGTDVGDPGSTWVPDRDARPAACHHRRVMSLPPPSPPQLPLGPDGYPVAGGVTRRGTGPAESARANRSWWDAAAPAYLAEHGDDLGAVDFLWCPEGLREADAHLLGDVTGRRVLEIGCGSAPCARWLRRAGAEVTALDVSGGMLARAAELNRSTGVAVPLLQADAGALPLADDSMDLACSAFGGLPFVADARAVLAEVRRVLRPGGRFVASVNHPMRWPLPDSPDPADLQVTGSYFDRRPYVETDGAGRTVYVEHHRTVGDWVRAVVGAGLVLTDLLEPEWMPGRTQTWGQWSPARGALVPGTLVLVCDVPAQVVTVAVRSPAPAG